MNEAAREFIDEMCWVHELIEKYMMLYMTKKEIVYVLSHGSKIEPGLVEIVWELMEKENSKFFRAYHMRLVVKNQIEQFNNLVEKQSALMSRQHPASASIPLTIEAQSHPRVLKNHYRSQLPYHKSEFPGPPNQETSARPGKNNHKKRQPEK